MSTLSSKTIAVIMGGGAGTRLYPLTHSRAKPAVPIGGKYRLVDIPISNSINAHINRIFVISQYNSASLNKHIKNTYQFGHFAQGFVDILAAEQTPDNSNWLQGTADAVRHSLKHIYNTANFEYVLVLSGDQLYQMDFNKMLEHHVQTGADFSIATIPVKKEDATHLGILKVDGATCVTAFVEKPIATVLDQWKSPTSTEMKMQGREYLASMGIYIFNKKVLQTLLLDTFKHAVDFGKEVIPNSISSLKVSSFQYEGYWTDIGNISSFFYANLHLTENIPFFNLFDESRVIFTRPRMLPPVKIIGKSSIDKALLSEGSIIHSSYIQHALIGVRSRIGHHTHISDAYIMGNDFYETLEDIAFNATNNIPPVGIGENCKIHHAIIDKNCRIGNHVTIVGGDHLKDVDTPLYTVQNGIVVVKKRALLPDNFTIS
ncbi:MAG: glucose-1-phosphate adenylyltransferase [Phycisphaerales bacterium]|nr:glucose-1-phosphate adenylyltransferase [Phycisphaerales bacterium]